MARQKTFTDQIREAIATCGQTQYAICKQTSIDQAVLSRFMNHKGFFSEESMNALAGAVGLTIKATNNQQVKHGMAGKAKR